MPSSSRPYKSKLLRFVLQQWQQGLERQDRAWRQLQSTAAWGAQVAVFPIYAIMRSVERARFVLGQNSSNSQRPAEPITAAQGKVTDLDHSLTAILTHTQQLLSSEQRARLALVPKSNTPRQAKSLLVTVVERIRQPFSKRIQPTDSSSDIVHSPYNSGESGHLMNSRKIQQQRGDLSTGGTTKIARGIRSGLAQNRTTLASSIKTRKLVLVNLKNEVFDIFTPEQQTNLKHYIVRIMHAYQQARIIVPRQPKQLSVKAILAIGGVFIAVLPAELKKAWTQVAPGPQLPNLPQSSPSPQPRSRIFYPKSWTPAAVKPRTGQLHTSNITPPTHRLTSKSPDAFEANVNSVSYLEHPLEKILRWIDRLLTWCERRWQQWLDHRANMG